MRRYSLIAVLVASVGVFFFLEFHLWADSYKILNYGSPERFGYRQIDSCGFDAIMEHLSLIHI